MTEKDDRVGVGPTYDAIREAARGLVSLFMPPLGVPAQPHWGAGLVQVEPTDQDKHCISITHPVCSQFEQRGNALFAEVDIVGLRAMAITLLAYCEAHEETSVPGGLSKGSERLPAGPQLHGGHDG